MRLVVETGGCPGRRDVVLGGVGALVVAQLHLLEVQILPRDDGLLHLVALEALHAFLGAPEEADAGQRLHVQSQLLGDADGERQHSVQRRRQSEPRVARRHCSAAGVHARAGGAARRRVRAARRRVRAAGLESVERPLLGRRRQCAALGQLVVVLILVALVPLLRVARHLKQANAKRLRPIL